MDTLNQETLESQESLKPQNQSKAQSEKLQDQVFQFSGQTLEIILHSPPKTKSQMFLNQNQEQVINSQEEAEGNPSNKNKSPDPGYQELERKQSQNQEEDKDSETSFLEQNKLRFPNFYKHQKSKSANYINLQITHPKTLMEIGKQKSTDNLKCLFKQKSQQRLSIQQKEVEN